MVCSSGVNAMFVRDDFPELRTIKKSYLTNHHSSLAGLTASEIATPTLSIMNQKIFLLVFIRLNIPWHQSGYRIVQLASERFLSF